MSMNKIVGFIFALIFIVILYLIIIYALKIMYKDVQSGGKKKALKKALGLEIVNPGENTNLKKGSVLPIRGVITIGRKEENSLVLSDKFTSGNHAKIYVKNDKYILEDLKSTNGTLLNEEKIMGKAFIESGDEIQIGSVLFLVIG